ncbi:PAS domain-containing protein [Kordiimonas pumila]|uniref:PAS domain-containing protein n=1 Tax=Kordiimonas pumila TaxID=2161677 RepID=A0ABV7D114_9PROT|nr:PAS domain-containing protein [Kordiimonas pumila]
MSIQASIQVGHPHQSISAIDFNPRGILQIVWQQWQHLHTEAAQAIPKKKSLSMKGLKGALPDIVLAERTGPDQIMVRISGTRIDELMGHVISGQNLLNIIKDGQKERINAVYHNISDHACGFHISENFKTSTGGYIEMDILVLPLADPEGDCCYYLIGYHFSDHQYFNPFSKAGFNFKDRTVNHIGYIDLGNGVPRNQ